MARAVLSLLTVGVIIYALVDCWRSRPDEVQRLTRAGWAVVILLVPLVGAIAYLTLGRLSGPLSVRGGDPRVAAPDDDPEFLRTLDFERRQAATRERRRREAEEKRRKGGEPKQERKADRKIEPVEEHEDTDGPDT